MNDRTDLTEDRLAAELAAGLTALADSPAPLGRTDTAWAIRRGRSRLRRRRLGVLGAVTAVAVGASVLGATLPDRDTAGPQKAATGPAAPDPVLPALGPETGHARSPSRPLSAGCPTASTGPATPSASPARPPCSTARPTALRRPARTRWR